MIDALSKDPLTFFLVALFCVIIWYWILFKIVAAAVKSGVGDLIKLLKKDLELKGVNKEEIDDLLKKKPFEDSIF